MNQHDDNKGNDQELSEREIREDEERNERIQGLLKGLAIGIDVALLKGIGDRMGWALLLFEPDEPEVVLSFISNCETIDMVKALREAADRLEKKGNVSPTIH